MLLVEPIRSKVCLAGFRSQVNEIERFARIAHTCHHREDGSNRVFCLYEDDALFGCQALGFYTLAIKVPEGLELLALQRLTSRSRVALMYIEFFALRTEHQSGGLANWLMADAFIRIGSIFEQGGDFSLIAVNAHEKTSEEYFRGSWGFQTVATASHPLMILRASEMKNALEKLKTWNEA